VLSSGLSIASQHQSEVSGAVHAVSSRNFAMARATCSGQPRTVKRTAAGLRYRRSGQLTSTGVLRRKVHPVVTLTNGDTRTAATSLRGTRYPHEYRCSACGYGIAVRELPVACPMCGGAAWELVEAKAVLAPEDLRGAERRTSSAAECPARLRRSEGSAAGPGRM
jgi:hypothetical protein